MTLKEIVHKSICDALETQSITPETAIFGNDSSLDSLGLVGLLADIEQQVYSTLGKQIIIASDRAMSQNRSPFRTVGSLTLFVEELSNESSNHRN